VYLYNDSHDVEAKIHQRFSSFGSFSNNFAAFRSTAWHRTAQPSWVALAERESRVGSILAWGLIESKSYLADVDLVPFQSCNPYAGRFVIYHCMDGMERASQVLQEMNSTIAQKNSTSEVLILWELMNDLLVHGRHELAQQNLNCAQRKSLV
jgi:hypothetical protein